MLRAHSDQKLNLNIENVQQWLRLLRMINVQLPVDTLSNYPILLQSRAETAAARSVPLLLWMTRLGLSQAETGNLLGKCPLALLSASASIEATERWLRTKLQWDSGMICKALVRDPRLFHFTDTHVEAQWLAMQAMGLSQAQVAEMARKLPKLLRRNMSSNVMQLKVRFLVEVMGISVIALVKDPNYLTRSLTGCIGPRWAFRLLYCGDNTFGHTSKLSRSPQQFVDRLNSSTLDAECLQRGVTRLQLFQEFVLNWPQEEGREWCRPNRTDPTTQSKRCSASKTSSSTY